MLCYYAQGGFVDDFSGSFWADFWPAFYSVDVTTQPAEARKRKRAAASDAAGSAAGRRVDKFELQERIMRLALKAHAGAGMPHLAWPVSLIGKFVAEVRDGGQPTYEAFNGAMNARFQHVVRQCAQQVRGQHGWAPPPSVRRTRSTA
jgi:hypothetical protein